MHMYGSAGAWLALPCTSRRSQRPPSASLQQQEQAEAASSSEGGSGGGGGPGMAQQVHEVYENQRFVGLWCASPAAACLPARRAGTGTRRLTRSVACLWALLRCSSHTVALHHSAVRNSVRLHLQPKQEGAAVGAGLARLERRRRRARGARPPAARGRSQLGAGSQCGH